MLYFAFGSNMSSKRLGERISSIRFISTARLDKHQLTFNKKSRDGSGKCDAVYTGDQDDRVFGVLFEIDESELKTLDKVEGVNFGYEQKDVNVTTSTDELQQAIMYSATDTETGLQPYSWYKEHVLQGAREYGLPEIYIQEIESVDTIPDPDIMRSEQEMDLYK